MLPTALRTLRAKILLTVIVCAILPMAAVGAWLTSTAVRSGEVLLRSRLDAVADRVAKSATERWGYRRSDILFLASNEPIRSALRDQSTRGEPPAFLSRALASMPTISRVVVRDTAGHDAWTLRTDSSMGVADRGIDQPPEISVRVPVRDDTGRVLGELLAFVPLETLVSMSPAQDSSTEIVALHDRASNGWLLPGLLTPPRFDNRFSWQNRRWIAVHRSLEAPQIDIIAAGQLDPFVEPFEKTARIGAAALAAVAFAVLVVTIVVSGRLTASVAQLGAAADAVAMGDFDQRIEEHSRDEVGRVARAFNLMAASIRSMMKELSQREAVAAMGELAATIAHQVRSPATAVRLDVQRAHDKLPVDSDARTLLSRALDQLDRLERAIVGALKVARSSGAEFRRVDLHNVLRRAADGCVAECRARDVSIDIRELPTTLSLEGDDASLEQLFTNVLMNAVQASSPRGSVRVAGDQEASRVIVQIRDNGIGMSSEVRRRAGEPGFSTKREGSGLGLSIARRIAAAHRGTIAIDSVDGGGTTVTIELALR